ncbi:hypothetical protein F2P81_008627 [Scophthalmus maximus]|uniref:Uncharacterized protein n=1 Tax=Scophthalmus maximus TaxID=52904 RepID=A0A6A4SW76_SCOMX|nr:hypothetical protein F2P81_008627 [Scophthalmus maximus]
MDPRSSHYVSARNKTKILTNDHRCNVIVTSPSGSCVARQPIGLIVWVVVQRIMITTMHMVHGPTKQRENLSSLIRGPPVFPEQSAIDSSGSR